MARIKNLKELREMPQEYAVYRLSIPFTAISDDSVSEFTVNELFMFNGKNLVAVSDRTLVNPSILFKAKIELLTLGEDTK